MFKRTKSLASKILNKLFLRSTIHDTAIKVDALHERMDHLLHCLAATPSDLTAQGGISHQIADQSEQLADRLAIAVIDLRRGVDRMSAEQDRKIGLLLKELAELRKAFANDTKILKDIAPDKPAKKADQSDGAPAPTLSGGGPAVDDLPADGPDTTDREPDPDRGPGSSEIRSADSLENRATGGPDAVPATGGSGGGITMSEAPDPDRRQTGDRKSGGAPDRGIGVTPEQVRRRGHGSGADVTGIEHDTFRQDEALMALGEVLSLRHPLPAARGGGALPDLLSFLYERIRAVQPGHVVELGSGVSTLVIAAALRDNGQGRLWSFEHDLDIAITTRDFLDREGLGDRARIEHAPLRRWNPRSPRDLSENWNWYDLGQQARQLRDIDFLVVNGPPAAEGRLARYPAVPALIDTLAEGAVIMLDGTLCEGEKRTAEQWRDAFGLELELDTGFERGLAILTLNAPRPTTEEARRT